MKQPLLIQSVGTFEAKTHLSKLLEKVRLGASFVITKNGEEIAELKPVGKKKRFELGCDKGEISIHEDFNDPLTDFADYQ